MLASPYSPYGAAALVGEELARVFYATYRLETVSLRLFNTYGPRQAVTGDSAGVVARFSDTILRGKTPVIYGDGKQSRDFVFISDIVEAVRLACTAPKAEGEVFNIASGSRITSALASASGRCPPARRRSHDERRRHPEPARTPGYA